MVRSRSAVRGDVEILIIFHGYYQQNVNEKVTTVVRDTARGMVTFTVKIHGACGARTLSVSLRTLQ